MTIAIVNSTEQKKGPVRLLPFPYPYQAALAISNDIDDASPELFTEIHRALNTCEETPLGPGLGLEITDSLWLWGSGVHLLDDQNKLTPQAKKLAELASQGWIDALHGLGDFNSRGGCTRELAELAYKTLDRLDIKLRSFINHGDRFNSQNLFCRIAPEYRGDDPLADEYHADLAYEHGIRWFWADELVSHPLSPSLPDTSKQFADRVKLHGKNLIKTLLGKSMTRRHPASIAELAHPHTLRDGNTIWNFTRYNNHPEGIWHRPGRHSFASQLSDKFLNDLLTQQGWAVVYTHFGQPAWQPGTPLFDKQNWQALQRIADLYHQGKLLVAGTQRLLDLWRQQKYLQWETIETEDNIIIDIKHIKCPVEGKLELNPEQCLGLSFQVKTTCKQLAIQLGNHTIIEDEQRTTDPEGKTIVAMPHIPLSTPVNGFSLE